MSTESIQFTLRERFAAPLPEFYQRRIIFWQDEDREFESMLDELYIPDVTILKLTGTNNMVTKLPAITEQDCKMVDDMMTKYSFVEHSQPSDILPLQYTIEEIENDIQAFITWITEYLKKQNP